MNTDTLSSFAPFAGAAMATAGTFYTANSSKSIAKKQLAAQKEENELNRQYNSAEAQKARDYQTAMQKAYQEYNTPSAQARRLAEAGMHPNSMLGNLQAGDYGITSSPSSSYATGLSPVGYTPPDFTSAARTLAETRLLNSQADKNEADAHNSESQALTEDMMRSGKIVLQGIEIELGKWAEKMAPDQAKKLKGEILSLEDSHKTSIESLNEIKARTANIKQDTLLKYFDTAFASESFRYRIRTMASECHISEAQAKYAVARQVAELLNLDADTNSKLASAFQSSSLGKYFSNKQELESKEWDSFKDVRYTHSVLENRRMRYDLEMDESFETTERGLKIANMTSNTAGNLFQMIDDFFYDHGKELVHDEYIYDENTGRIRSRYSSRSSRRAFGRRR